MKVICLHAAWLIDVDYCKTQTIMAFNTNTITEYSCFVGRQKEMNNLSTCRHRSLHRVS